MGYDPLLESVRLIDSGPPATPVGLSRRRRFIPLAVDVEDDVAVAVFLRRGAGADSLEGHLLTRKGRTWRLHGGGGGSETLDELARPRSLAELGGYGRANGGAGVLVSASPRIWLEYAWLELVPEVVAVLVDGRRLAVPWHHHAAVVRRTGQAEYATLIGVDGQAVGRLSLKNARLDR